MAETIITVQGEFELRRPADLGIVHIRVDFDGEDRQATLALAIERHGKLVAELRELHEPRTGPVAEWSSDQVRVWGERSWNQEGRQLPPVFHAQAEIEATFGDIAALSEWVGSVSLHDGVSLNGIEWRLADARRQSLTQEARRRAVENAVAKATVYATSLGLSSVRPLALSDPGMLGDGPAPVGGSVQPFAARAMSADAGGMTVALKPEEITITVQVHARFAAS